MLHFVHLMLKMVKNTSLPSKACDDMLGWLLAEDGRYFVKKNMLSEKQFRQLGYIQDWIFGDGKQ